MADQFALSYPDLQIRFGLMSREEVWNYLECARLSRSRLRPSTAPKSAGSRDAKLSELAPRADAPPL